MARRFSGSNRWGMGKIRRELTWWVMMVKVIGVEYLSNMPMPPRSLA